MGVEAIPMAVPLLVGPAELANQNDPSNWPGHSQHIDTSFGPPPRTQGDPDLSISLSPGNNNIMPDGNANLSGHRNPFPASHTGPVPPHWTP